MLGDVSKNLAAWIDCPIALLNNVLFIIYQPQCFIVQKFNLSITTWDYDIHGNYDILNILVV